MIQIGPKRSHPSVHVNETKAVILIVIVKKKTKAPVFALASPLFKKNSFMFSFTLDIIFDLVDFD